MRLPRLAFAWQPQRGGGSEFQDFLQSLRRAFRFPPRDGGTGGRAPGPSTFPFWRLAPVAVVLLVIVWLGSGIYVVNPGEVGAVRTFGAWTNQSSEGLHWHVPWPVERVDVLSVQRVQSIEVGYRTTATGQGVQPVPLESRMITGDENLVEVQIVVQYRIREAASFLFNVKDPGGRPDVATLRDATESALRQVVGQRPVDDVLTLGKAEVQAATHQLLQSLLDAYGTGILVVNVQLQDVQPPAEVQEAFKDVIGAREDRDRFINEAQAYMEDIVPRARGQAEKIILDAEAFKNERIAKATGEANRFQSRLVEYRQAQEATRLRLYLETLEKILPNLKLVLIDPKLGGNVLPFLPLEQLLVSGEAPKAQGASQ